MSPLRGVYGNRNGHSARVILGFGEKNRGSVPIRLLHREYSVLRSNETRNETSEIVRDKSGNKEPVELLLPIFSFRDSVISSRGFAGIN